MADSFHTNEPGRGRISEGPVIALIDRTVDFVRSELAGWRDDPDRAAEEAEERLNAQLCKYLNVAASHRFPMVKFSHEEKQTGTRRVDMSALPSDGGFVGETYYSIYDPLLVFEGKRLPTPPRKRQREYVTGGSDKSGGIQRFKLALHGALQATGVMVGYIQKADSVAWISLINQWIRDLAATGGESDETWSEDELLADFSKDASLRTASASSECARSSTAVSSRIKLRHLWVEMST